MDLETGFAGVVTVKNQKIWNMELGISLYGIRGQSYCILWKTAELFGHGGWRFGNDMHCLTRKDLLDSLFITKVVLGEISTHWLHYLDIAGLKL